VTGMRVRLGFKAPTEIAIWREEMKRIHDLDSIAVNPARPSKQKGPRHAGTRKSHR
jgi:sRNA-binding carbon storage regulator CsrA